MSAVFSEAGERIPVTVLKYEPMVVSQVKTEATDGYSSVQSPSFPIAPRKPTTHAKLI